jgi:hypothetical protein
MEDVALPAKLLGADEHVVIHTRTHVKAMILPALAFVLIAAAVGAGAAALADYHLHHYQPTADHAQRHPQQDRQGPPAEPDQ